MPTSFETDIRAAGLKMTAGRVALLAALEHAPHSDAESLHRVLATGDSAISIQSVHNVLRDLTSSGLLRRIEPANSPARYERRVGDNHHHVVCTSCGAIADVECVVGHAPCMTPGDAGGFSIASAEVTFWGLCAPCQLGTSQPDQLSTNTAPPKETH